jgi:hypothetical protein
LWLRLHGHCAVTRSCAEARGCSRNSNRRPAP